MMQDGDAVVIFNFRADRVVELSKALEYKDFDNFDRKRWPDVSHLACLPSIFGLYSCTACVESVHTLPLVSVPSRRNGLPLALRFPIRISAYVQGSSSRRVTVGSPFADQLCGHDAI